MTHNNVALNTMYKRSITLPRGTLDLTYQTNSATEKNVIEQSNHYQLEDLLGFAQRINPKRAFLFVSKVLGRHIPVTPSTMRHAFTDLANLVPDELPEPILVIGMAETAVGLSAGVHQALQTRYPEALLLNSTRHAQHDDSHDKSSHSLLTTFSEDHSHASQHLIYQSADNVTQAQLLASKTLIMVDDEASTGNTCVNVVTALRNAGLDQLEQVHLTTLVDWSLNQERHQHQDTANSDDAVPDQIAKRLPNIKFQRHHLLSGAWTWTDAPNPEPITMPSVDTTEAGSHTLGDTGNWGRFPTLDSTDGFDNYLLKFQTAFKVFNKQAQSEKEQFGKEQFEKEQLPKRILVLGSNEFVWLPFLLAEWLETQTQNSTVNFSALTRSPIALGGAITTMLSFSDNYGLGMTNFAYNVEPNDWDLIVLCVETSADSVDDIWKDLDNVLVVSPTL
ncbi:phosphoribosyltransferase domain-containing protein [Psychrobacter sp. ANT_H3]|uniref:phosphoribosyltransferase domain-containing protein n=1 Tax=Psychrobacter sp. ANT_H3 TaxID=3019444 RepID=UPI0022F18E20|nr:phosphoribosyltransferase domain-containing protein [Psychrobacter sp. ANT_H3]MDA5133332.1 phosphoribosyltransferase domain-containing protein [Psychrobacter sp. ANT_H3]